MVSPQKAVFVLDSSALIRYIDDEAGAERVEEVLGSCVSENIDLCISAMQWGEVAGNLRKRFGATEEARILSSLLPSEVKIVAATSERAVRAADLKIDRKLSFSDAFAVDLTLDSVHCTLITADYDFKAVEDLIRIEFLPVK